MRVGEGYTVYEGRRGYTGLIHRYGGAQMGGPLIPCWGGLYIDTGGSNGRTYNSMLRGGLYIDTVSEDARISNSMLGGGACT